MQAKYILKYFLNGVEQCSEGMENEHYTITADKGDGTLNVTITPKTYLELKTLTVEFPYEFGENDAFFAGGYQSWTKTREYKRDDIQRRSIKLADMSELTSTMAKLTGDEWFVEYSEKPGEFISHCYTYVKNEKGICLLGSIDEKQGFTYFKVKMRENIFTINKDLEGKTISQPITPLKMVYLQGDYEDVFDKYFAHFPASKHKDELMVGYTSWYNYFQKIDEDIILRDLDGLDFAQDKVSIFQIDDGYETFVGDWTDDNPKDFPHGMKYIADKIHEKGYKAGIWLAPFNCQRVSKIAKEHPDWLVRKANGHKMLGCIAWGGAYTLDIYNPEVREHLKKVFDTVLNVWGFDMVKLDFLYSECIIPRENKSRGEIMCEAMEFLRECCGDKLILGCSVPLGTSFGIVDACRISCDVDLNYSGQFYSRMQVSNEMLSARSAINNSIFRRHLNGRVFMNDPDVFFLRNDNLKFTEEQKLLLAKINNLCGNVLFISDNAGFYDENQRNLLLKYFTKTDEKIIAADYIDKDVIRLKVQDGSQIKTLTFNLEKGKVLKGYKA